MTFSIAARCARTGAFGLAISTSSLAVGARCPFARAGVGAVLTQNRTDPRLGPQGLAQLEAGLPAPAALEAVMATAPHAGWRQVAMIDRQGHAAYVSGDRITSIHAGATGRDCVAIGNLLADIGVPPAMVAAFEAAGDRDFGDRLMGALAAGLAAGGEHKPVQSAALLIVDREPFPVVDLRVDAHDRPIAELDGLWRRYRPLMPTMLAWALDPDAA